MKTIKEKQHIEISQKEIELMHKLYEKAEKFFKKEKISAPDISINLKYHPEGDSRKINNNKEYTPFDSEKISLYYNGEAGSKKIIIDKLVK